MSSSPTDPTIDCDFPKAASIGYALTSSRSSFYNCIAWAAGRINNKWWPLPHKIRGWYWPPGIRADVSIETFIEMFSKVEKYAEWDAENADFEEGWSKIAIYAKKDGEPTHAARQLPNGKWTSKLGGNRDIEHTLDVLESSDTKESAYGKAVKIMRRRGMNVPQIDNLHCGPASLASIFWDAGVALSQQEIVQLAGPANITRNGVWISPQQTSAILSACGHPPVTIEPNWLDVTKPLPAGTYGLMFLHERNEPDPTKGNHIVRFLGLSATNILEVMDPAVAKIVPIEYIGNNGIRLHTTEYNVVGAVTFTL